MSHLIDSILTSTKKMLSIAPSDDSFDMDVIMHINGVFSTLHQLGVGPDEGFMIEDEDDEWDDYLDTGRDRVMLNMVKILMFLEIRMIFDPPASSFALGALKDQADEKKWRLNVMAEDKNWLPTDADIVLVIDGGTV